MKLSRGRGKVLLKDGNKKSIEIIDGYYTEDGTFFIYKTKNWYALDTKSGLSFGKSKNYLTKKEIVDDFPKVIKEFERMKQEHTDMYVKTCSAYKRLCREYDLNGGRR